ncbi:two-partner secretion domain-containing protein [Candidatus Nitrospira nitrosa]|uniref:two-partner secretion domain-containing protein n=1 Tax=Candidatus Nitrospira nitrosa TaxID=1742972 RepID=UPI00159EC16B|nr:filamentous hemagglutinin N-terminal domain-containing protein [Candidatus Nitrospira nitrosa]
MILILGFLGPLAEAPFTLAQITTAITPTTGEGNLGTVATPQNTHTIQITGGTRSDQGGGTNLFHSFKQFSVGHGDTALFLNTTPALPTNNILSQVTGGSPSNIFGTIDTMSYPKATLFLMNPAGIVFGPNAVLNVGGSVAFTTANYMRLAEADGSNAGIFHANSTTSHILTSAPVVAFGFLTANPAAIAVQGSTLTVQAGQAISLIGGDMTIESGKLPNNPALDPLLPSAPGKQVYIASVASPGEILARTLTPAVNIAKQSFEALGTVTILKQSIIDTSGRDGTIHIRGGRLVIDDSMLFTHTGNISLDATSLQITNNGQVLTETLTRDHAGHITINAQGDINIDSSENVGSFSSHSSGRAGNVTISSNQGNITLTKSTVFQDVNGSGDTGNITFHAPHGDISLTNSSIASRASGTGTLGDIQIQAYNLHLREGSKIGGDNTGTSTQAPGNISIALDGQLSLASGSFINTEAFTSATAADLIIKSPAVFIAGKDSSSKVHSGLYTDTISTGNGGHLRVFTDNLQLMDGGILSSKSFVGSKREIPSGHGGVVNVEGYRNPGTLITINGSGSGIFTSTEGTGTAGDIVMKGASVTLQNEGKISAETTGISSKASGGSITVTATDHVTLTNNALITASTSGPGNAGNILVKTNDISISGGSTITASSTGSGNAGTVTVQGLQGPASSFLIDGSNSGVFTKTTNAGTGGNLSVSSNSIVIQNKGSISGETSGTGSGGNIALTAGQSVTIQNGASITARSTGPADAGSISINAGQQLDVIGTGTSRSSITTESNQAQGGDINIQAIDRVRVVDSEISTSVLGGAGSGGNITIDPKVVLLQNSDILAQANRGTGGDISITTPVFIADQSSRVDASTPFGLNGRVTIQSPTSNLSGTVGQLVSKTSPPQVLLQNRCVALAGGEQSTFLLAGRDALPGEPIGWLSSPVSMEHWTGEDTAHASRLMARNQNIDSSLVIAAHSNKSRVLSLRRLTPPGFLVRTFATGATGCPS